ncbi:MAG: PrpF domain-containing protein [Thalassobaculum sp.]|uniref:2-methylaconitate cis-trans isomerase PrpF family protein n=1 Tax=Thalassobaculum sp. TaxID=2022740 RepID=UPI0032EC430C
MTQRAIPAVFMRGGSSKGVFFHARDLPTDRSALDPILLSVIGSPDPYGRQLDGMGGGISSLSKAVIIGPPTRPDCDVDYSFAQVAVDRPVVDWAGNCGNLSSAVGPFAVDEGLVAAADGEALVRIHQVNTAKVIHARFPVAGGKAVVTGDFAIAGVAGTGARIRLDFLDPGGAGTGQLLPTGNARDHLDVPGVGPVAVSMVDAANPIVFVAAGNLGLAGSELPDAIEARPDIMAALDWIRRQAAIAMGMAAAPEEAALSVPKVALLAAPAAYRTLDGQTVGADAQDIAVRMISMERAHRAVPLTGAMCLGVAARLPGTVAHALARHGGGDEVRVANPSGVLSVGAVVEGGEARSALVFRTARRLMQGEVLIP